MTDRTDTSAVAYAGIAPTADHLRGIVHRVLCAHPAGLTVDETCNIAGYPRYSLQPRFTLIRKLAPRRPLIVSTIKGGRA